MHFLSFQNTAQGISFFFIFANDKIYLYKDWKGIKTNNLKMYSMPSFHLQQSDVESTQTAETTRQQMTDIPSSLKLVRKGRLLKIRVLTI